MIYKLIVLTVMQNSIQLLQPYTPNQNPPHSEQTSIALRLSYGCEDCEQMQS